MSTDQGTPQGRCETTHTERFKNNACRCQTYEGNLGPCKSFLAAADPARCVYCDHNAECHQAVADNARTEMDREAASREKYLYGGHAALWRAKLGPTSSRR